MRKGMQRAASVRTEKGGFPVFSTQKNARILTHDAVKRAEEDD
jgi:hypothetical protein